MLFVVIIPNNSGVKGKLRHKWSTNESGISVIYDFKKNEVSTAGIVTIPFSWKVTDDNHLTLEISALGQSGKEDFTFTISPDGKTLTLAPVDYPSQTQEWTRVD